MKRKEKTAQRGYGMRHQALRKRLEPIVASGQAICARYGLNILPGEPWALGHIDGSRTAYAGPEHQACNRATSAHRKAKRARRERPGVTSPSNSDPARSDSNFHPAPWRSETGIPCSRQWSSAHMSREDWLAIPADERRRRERL